MLKFAKYVQVFTLILLLSVLLVGATVKAQAQATVEVMAAVGGTTDPTGTTTYADGTAVTLTATAGDGFVFANWVIVTSAGGYEDLNNPTTLTVNATIGTYVVQAIFQPVQSGPTLLGAGATAVTNYASAAIVVVLASVGGTTSPVPGTYALTNAESFNLQATADSGWTFDHWVIGGGPLTHGAYSFTDTPTNNPYNVNHGYGNTYTYLPVFKPTSTSTSSSPTVPEFSSAAAVVIALALVAVAFGTYAYRRKTK